jgi:hypothetical protein
MWRSENSLSGGHCNVSRYFEVDWSDSETFRVFSGFCSSLVRRSETSEPSDFVFGKVPKENDMPLLLTCFGGRKKRVDDEGKERKLGADFIYPMDRASSHKTCDMIFKVFTDSRKHV